MSKIEIQVLSIDNPEIDIFCDSITHRTGKKTGLAMLECPERDRGAKMRKWRVVEETTSWQLEVKVPKREIY